MLQNPELHYLDNAATTIVAPEVADVINKAMREHWANPSSLYAPGARSEEALNAARAAVARTLGCKSRELYFTSCGSESNNMALLGAALTRRFGKGIVVSGFEHPSVQKPLERLAAMGYDVTVVDPGPDGTLDIDRMLEELEKQFNSLLAEASAAGGTEDYAERFRMISNAMADLKEHKSRIMQVYQENELVSQRLKAASIAMSAYAAEPTEWDQSVVYQLVEKVTVLAKDKIRVTFRNGTEVEQEIEQLDWRNAS